ncbi:MAG: hypothetical protein WAM94_00945 [Chromatiaceae bacterium]
MKKARKRGKFRHKMIVALDARPAAGEVYMEMVPDRRGTADECDKSSDEKQEGQSESADSCNFAESKPSG